MRRICLVWGSFIVCCTAVIWSPVQAEFQLDSDRQAGEVIESLVVRIDVGEGEDLQEPIALDLGLGFPFWLSPVGQDASEPIPFGAIPQQSTAPPSVPAGSSATFRFSLQDDPEQDLLLVTPQLLSDVRVSDISRIGFVGQGTNNWTLSGYSIQVNGEIFVQSDNLNAQAQEVQDTARFELADLDLAIGPLATETTDLQALVDAGLAEEADTARLDVVQAELQSLVVQRRRLEGQIQGVYPWFVETEFDSPWRENSPVGSITVSLVTESHAGADTSNYVYFRAGGHKYLLGSPDAPLFAEAGAQRFELDSIAGPLNAADLRGYAVGMLGHPFPFGPVPDRWHPQRILVEVDGRIVYDSDESPIDHNSLEAIRVIPPAHVDEVEELVVNAPTLREVFVWEAGKGTGLDLVNGGALPFPPADSADFPGMEPGLFDDPMFVDDFPPGFDFPFGFDPFPGEAWAPGGFWAPGGWPGWEPGWGQPPTVLDWLMGWVAVELGILPPGIDPPPVGMPFQIESTAVTSGWKYDDTFTVEWSVSGDEGEIDHYDVLLLATRPDQLVPIEFAVPLASDTVAAGTSQCSFSLAAVPVGLDYLVPMVVAVPLDPLAVPYQRIGPARAIFPIGSEPFGQPAPASQFLVMYPPMMIDLGPVTLGDPPPLGRAVWVAGQGASHNAILFDDASPGLNIGYRPEPTDLRMFLNLTKSGLVGKQRVTAYVGFLGGSGGGNTADVEMRCHLDGPLFPPVAPYAPQTVSLTNPVGGPPVPMEKLEMVVDRADAPAMGTCSVIVRFRIEGGAVDPNHPPALFGVRIVPEP